MQAPRTVPGILSRCLSMSVPPLLAGTARQRALPRTAAISSALLFLVKRLESFPTAIARGRQLPERFETVCAGVSGISGPLRFFNCVRITASLASPAANSLRTAHSSLVNRWVSAGLEYLLCVGGGGGLSGLWPRLRVFRGGAGSPG